MRITLTTGTPAELARPTNGEATGGLVLWADIFGLRPLFDGHAQRLADDHGWVVVAPELYPGEETMPIEARHARAATFSDADKLADAVAAADATGFEHVGVLGFCMGGMYAMKSLASNRFSRAVAFYGMVRVPEQWSGGTQGDAIDVVNERRERGDLHLLGIFGTNDPWCPLDQIDELEAAGAEVVRYEGADHGWAQDSTRDNYREADATDAWARAEAFLEG
ncbi:MAG TPA: dienelactone hydrolase family protein [Microthrixaceae bacterium]|nr:dienelactone hydrolase family protein [Microthrixaceae bacterium]